MTKYLLLILGIAVWVSDPGFVSGNDVPKAQQEAVAQVVGYVFVVAASVCLAIETAISGLKREQRR